MEATLHPADHARNARRAAAASAVGSLVEWYDFALYGAAAALIFKGYFFGSSDPAVGLIAAFATFAVGYFARPFGGIVFGHLGDKIGRKPVMVVTLMIMGLSTALIAVLPGYANIGFASPALLVALRILQGLGAGAEYAGAIILSSESSGPARRGFYASWSGSATWVGSALALFAFQAVLGITGPAFYTWGWRIPFLLSLVMLAVSYYIRRRVFETEQFKKAQDNAEIERIPLLRLFRTEKRRLLVAMGCNFFSGFSYIPQVWALSYLTNNIGLAALLALGINAALLVAGAATAPYFGHLSDRIGRRKLYMAGLVFAAAGAFPMFMIIDTHQPALIAVDLVVYFVGAVSTVFAAQAAFLTELFPPAVRYTGVAFAREITGAILGGAAPLIATALFAWSGHWWPIALYMVANALVALVAVYYSKYFRSDTNQGSEDRFNEDTVGRAGAGRPGPAVPAPEAL
ncbi:hypothetical protein SA2016_0954 [Sinomonas atrocyanea]|uniref:Major facilitator superfamily (MFS) profile domain-containing protein n=1 Tax=Sinomonas atrocyanea TaxID=37927 RepID=A0A126ZWS3_9MICC|nr:MFS transporter [Sinomonas atrocyanea]AMM31639.1 hypothetical protein SA2016_0954 [Sinomonas atrocyanea]GEB64209.1 shikimate transporter [Sinomonas atrocyanea]GGG57226.1 shikimate transporter [Sinomonas atrocyanea]